MQESGEMYLETIFLLLKKKDCIHAIDVANHMGFSKPSVSRALSNLSNDNYIVVSTDGHIALSEKGRRTAKKIYERHQTIKTSLLNLGLNHTTANEDACRIEHYISDETFNAIKQWNEFRKVNNMKTDVIYQSKNLKISYIVLGLLSNNVYIIESNNQFGIVDPSCRENDILEFAGTKNISKIILTHYHFDHVGAAHSLKKLTNAKTFASEIDSEYIENPDNIPVFHRKVDACNVDIKLREGNEIKIGSSFWKVFETPGHTKGGICLYNANADRFPILISGDTLFKRSCGRTDFEDSDPQKMQESLIKLSKLPDETLVLPGHESMTTIEHERHYMLCNL